MKRILLGVLTILLLFLFLFIFLLFTPWGNGILSKFLERKVESALMMDVSLKLRLTPSKVSLNILHGDDELLSINGTHDILFKRLQLTFDTKIKNISIFSHLAGRSLEGSFANYGSLTLGDGKARIEGKALFAGGYLNYDVKSSDDVRTVKLKGDGFRLKKLMRLVGEKPEFDAVLSLTSHLSGKEYLSGYAHIGLFKDHKKTIAVDVKPLKISPASNSASGSYTVSIPDLDKLYFITKRHMRGSLVVKGSFEKDQNLKADAHTHWLGGYIQMEIANQDAKIKAKDLELVKLFDVLMYPKFFDSHLNLNADYNIATMKGTFYAHLVDGRFVPSRFTQLIRSISGFDITRERYADATVNGTINGNLVVFNLFMRGPHTSIKSEKARYWIDRNTVDAPVLIEVKGVPIEVRIRGDVKRPKLEVKLTRDFIEEKARRFLKMLR